MAEREARRVAHELMEEPHISGRRISVRHVYALVEEQDLDPATVADRFDLDVADVYHALAYYHDHPREMSDVEADRADAFDTFRESIERLDGVEPDTRTASAIRRCTLTTGTLGSGERSTFTQPWTGGTSRAARR